MHHATHSRIRKTALIALSLLALTSLSACANGVPTGPQAAATGAGWEHVHDGLLIGNIYTGDDHI